MELSLYIHIPFCAGKCDYCDFYSIAADSKILNRKEFLNILIKEINYQIDYFNVKNIPTVYIGGGTPSVLGKDIKIIFDALKKIPAFTPIEFTVEANPESLTEEFLDICKEGGVTRLSIGVQTFYDPSRLSVNRAGNAAITEKALSLASKYYPDTLSADLITGFPFHTKEIVAEDIKRLLDFNPASVSVYSLTVEDQTKLYKNLKEGKFSLPKTETADKLWLTARDMLIDNGYGHYEVSNFAKQGGQCIHNIRYWRMRGWMGAGPAASGTVIDYEKEKAVRYTNAPDLEAYLKNTQDSKEQLVINKEELLKEVLLMGYRYCEGPAPEWGVEKYIQKTLEKWKDKDKMLFLNNFLLDAFGELGNNDISNL
ncbi:MAG: radical SAM family heme chaperone HemW [Treponema sp.]|jgi:oxygen-independent coproporphyrinogen-3 oxidase|nr:radical SAM family heme chaperone HemW [Treponema sp.]